MGVARSSIYYKPEPKDTASDALLMNELREIYQHRPIYGYRRMTIELRQRGFVVNHKKVHGLLQIAGIKAIYPGKKTSIKNRKHKIFPYLLRDITINRPNQVWQVDITYIRIRSGFIYLICMLDVFSRKVMGWRLSTCLDTTACLEAFKNALKGGMPEIVNSDQGCQFTSEEWIKAVQQQGCRVSIDGKGRWADNVYIERFWVR